MKRVPDSPTRPTEGARHHNPSCTGAKKEGWQHDLRATTPFLLAPTKLTRQCYVAFVGDDLAVREVDDGHVDVDARVHLP